MMNTQRDIAYKIGCGRLLFEDHAFRYLPDEIRRNGEKAYILTGPHAWNADGKEIGAALNESRILHETDIYSGACSEEKADAIAEKCRQNGYNVIVGVGGGRIMDLAKTAAFIGGYPVINVPTIAATCAAYTPLSVIYTPDGACRGTWYFDREVDSVICDTAILSKEPARYLASGMLDAMAKWIEINHYSAVEAGNSPDVLAARLLAKDMYDTLFQNALQAYRQDESVIRNVLFHNIVTTGMISGIARGNFQAALAHGLYYAIRTLFGKESRAFLHGEVVAVGLIFQEMYLGWEEPVRQLRDLMKKLHMPTTLSELNVPHEEEALRALAASSTVTELLRPSSGELEKVYGLLKECL